MRASAAARPGPGRGDRARARRAVGAAARGAGADRAARGHRRLTACHAVAACSGRPQRDVEPGERTRSRRWRSCIRCASSASGSRLPANQPVVLLREEDGVRYLPIWIGAVEASAIAFQQQGVQTAAAADPRPAARRASRALGARLEAVHITELRDDVFYAELRFAGGVDGQRPARRTRSRWRCGATSRSSAADAVLDAAGIEIPDEQEDEVEKFREFLDHDLARGLRRPRADGGPRPVRPAV